MSEVTEEDNTQIVVPIWALKDRDGVVWLRFGEDEGEYFINAKTQETTWSVDLDEDADLDDIVMLTDWEMVADTASDGMYFYNNATGDSVWDLFTGMDDPSAEGGGFDPFAQRQVVREYEDQVNTVVLTVLSEAGFTLTSIDELETLPPEAQELVAAIYDSMSGEVAAPVVTVLLAEDGNLQYCDEAGQVLQPEEFTGNETFVDENGTVLDLQGADNTAPDGGFMYADENGAPVDPSVYGDVFQMMDEEGNVITIDPEGQAAYMMNEEGEPIQIEYPAQLIAAMAEAQGVVSAPPLPSPPLLAPPPPPTTAPQLYEPQALLPPDLLAMLEAEGLVPLAAMEGDDGGALTLEDIATFTHGTSDIHMGAAHVQKAAGIYAHVTHVTGATAQHAAGGNAAATVQVGSTFGANKASLAVLPSSPPPAARPIQSASPPGGGNMRMSPPPAGGLLPPPPAGSFTPPPMTSYTAPHVGAFTPPPMTNFAPPPATGFTPPPGTNFAPPPGAPPSYSPSPGIPPPGATMPPPLINSFAPPSGAPPPGTVQLPPPSITGMLPPPATAPASSLPPPPGNMLPPPTMMVGPPRGLPPSVGGLPPPPQVSGVGVYSTASAVTAAGSSSNTTAGTPTVIRLQDASGRVITVALGRRRTASTDAAASTSHANILAPPSGNKAVAIETATSIARLEALGVAVMGSRVAQVSEDTVPVHISAAVGSQLTGLSLPPPPKAAPSQPPAGASLPKPPSLFLAPSPQMQVAPPPSVLPPPPTGTTKPAVPPAPRTIRMVPTSTRQVTSTSALPPSKALPALPKVALAGRGPPGGQNTSFKPMAPGGRPGAPAINAVPMGVAPPPAISIKPGPPGSHPPGPPGSAPPGPPLPSAHKPAKMPPPATGRPGLPPPPPGYVAGKSAGSAATGRAAAALPPPPSGYVPKKSSGSKPNALPPPSTPGGSRPLPPPSGPGPKAAGMRPPPPPGAGGPSSSSSRNILPPPQTGSGPKMPPPADGNGAPVKRVLPPPPNKARLPPPPDVPTISEGEERGEEGGEERGEERSSAVRFSSTEDALGSPTRPAPSRSRSSLAITAMQAARTGSTTSRATVTLAMAAETTAAATKANTSSGDDAQRLRFGPSMAKRPGRR